MSGCRRRGVVGMGVAGGAALVLSACVSSRASGPRQSSSASPTATPTSDGRFAQFTEYVPEKLEVRADLGHLERRMPGIGITSAHWVQQYWQEERELLPAPDRPIWVHAVMGLQSGSAQALAAASIGAADLLPGIYPDLRQYVPKDDVFTTVPKEKADEILDVDHMFQDDPNAKGADSFGAKEVAVCTGSNLLILMANEHIF